MASKKPRKPTPNQIEWEKQVRRLQRLVKKAEHEGIVFTRSPIPETPRRITSTKLQEIKALDTHRIKEQGTTINPETGELLPFISNKSKEPITSKRPDVPSTSINSEIPIPKVGTKSKTKSQRSSQPHSSNKPLLTPEERAKIRSEAAKKAAQTRREREQADPELKAKRAKIRSEGAKKAAQTRRKQEQADPELKAKRDAVRNANLAKARAQKRLNKGLPPVEETEYTHPVTGNAETPATMPPETQKVLDRIRANIQSARNQRIADLLDRLLSDEIEEYGEDVVAERLSGADDFTKDLAEGAFYDSDSEEIGHQGYALAHLITGGDVPPLTAESIEQLAYEDAPWSVIARARREAKKAKRR